jgi:demethylmenaquinone methyltransferase/2-methoxy-6-polyprenyl-1,4-benzoquinol methylase
MKSASKENGQTKAAWKSAASASVETIVNSDRGDSHESRQKLTEKERYVRDMFDAIAPTYDLLNTLLSFRIHYYWRWVAGRLTELKKGDSTIDICCGTGDFSVELKRIVGKKGRVAAVDFSQGMLDQGAKKFAKWKIESSQADALNLPFPDGEFDASTMGFGVRNVSDPGKAIAEMARVVRPGGKVIVLEFSRPRNPVFAVLYEFYSKNLMPRIGALLSGRRDAYSYLPESVRLWISREQMTKLFKEAGLQNIKSTDLTFGIVCIHEGSRPGAEIRK